MQIVIDINEDTREWLVDIYNNANINEEIPLEFQNKMLYAIAKGTVLPKHGDLIDIDNIQEIELEDSLTILTHKKGDEVDWYIDAPTILEANRE